MANAGYIQVTRLCNQKCRFCSNPERDATLLPEDGRKLISEMKRNGYMFVVLTGGEPSMSGHLPALLSHCRDIGLPHKLVTNAQKTAEPEYLRMLVEHGLNHVCISFHSCFEETQNFLAENPESHRNILRTFENLAAYPDITIDIATTINKYNACQLSDNVRFLLRELPRFKHITWNNLDPRSNRATENSDTIATLNEFEVDLKVSMDLMVENGKPFRAERVPLCYMPDHEHNATETRRIVKSDERRTFFLDERGFLRWVDWRHGKAECCAVCSLDDICAGLYEMDVHYSSKELFPVFRDREEIVRKIVSGI